MVKVNQVEAGEVRWIDRFGLCVMNQLTIPGRLRPDGYALNGSFTSKRSQPRQQSHERALARAIFSLEPVHTGLQFQCWDIQYQVVAVLFGYLGEFEHLMTVYVLLRIVLRIRVVRRKNSSTALDKLFCAQPRTGYLASFLCICADGIHLPSATFPMKAALVSLAILFGLSNSLAQGCQCSVLEEASANEIEATDSLYASLGTSDSKACLAKYYEWLASKNLDAGKLDSVELHFLEAEKRYMQLTCGEAQKVQLYKLWAAYYYRKADFPKSLEYCLKLNSAAEQAGDRYEQSNVNTMIAQLFNQMGQADQGVVYARKAIPLMRQVQDDRKRADLIYKISKRFLWHYQDFAHQPSLDSFELFARQHLQLAKKNQDDLEISKAYSNIQGVAYERKDYKRAILYLDSSNRYTGLSQLNRAVNFYDLADLYWLDGNYPQALQAADSALRLYRNDISYVANTYDLISRIHRSAGNYQAALVAFERAEYLNDSITNLEKSEAFIELEKKYNQEKNEQRIKELSQRQMIYLLLALSAIMIAVVIGVLLRQKNLKQRQTILETEQRLNRARMNPHFFFNALAALQEHASRESDRLLVASSLAQFSRVMRKTLESTYHDMITIEAEMEFLHQYLEIQRMRFTGSFEYSVTASDEIVVEEQSLPSMLLQPFVENSLEHGFAGRKDGELSVHFGLAGNELHVIIEDNGRGFTSEKESRQHVSRATQIIQDRLYLLNLKHRSKARFTIREKPVGVRADIYLPLIYV